MYAKWWFNLCKPNSTLATWCEELTHWKRPWWGDRLKAGGKGDDRGWDGWMASATQWTWVWVNSGSPWWTGKLGVLQSIGSQRVRHDWATELDWCSITNYSFTLEYELLLKSYDSFIQNVRICIFCLSSVRPPPLTKQGPCPTIQQHYKTENLPWCLEQVHVHSSCWKCLSHSTYPIT